MKDFDRVELGAVRTLSEAEYFFKRNQGVAARQEIHSHYREKIKARYNKLFMRKGEEEL